MIGIRECNLHKVEYYKLIVCEDDNCGDRVERQKEWRKSKEIALRPLNQTLDCVNLLRWSKRAQ
jgi:hypothetical protein